MSYKNLRKTSKIDQNVKMALLEKVVALGQSSRFVKCKQTNKMSKTIEDVLNLIKLLPNSDEIISIVEDENEAAYILHMASENLLAIQSNKEVIQETSTEESFYLIECLVDKFWERINTGIFSELPLKIRKIFALANYFKIFYLLLEDLSAYQIENCNALLDDSMLCGYTQNLYAQHDQLREALVQLFDEVLEGVSTDCDLPILEAQDRKSVKSDILTLDCPTVMEFSEKCFVPQIPALLLNTFVHWPAVEKWRNLNYINKIAGNRCVPIEIGSDYTTDEFSQQIVKIRDFLQRQFGKDSASQSDSIEVEYLAQHELFDQIPALKDDIRVPDYCTLGTNSTDVNIRAWLGPKGTISPMHYDPKNNLLCQVFGTKYIILAAPKDTESLYPHETDLLHNTSQINAANIDFERFPLASKVKFYNVLLQTGDCLYIPPKWWHYVRAESPSFSVSFWWE